MSNNKVLIFSSLFRAGYFLISNKVTRSFILCALKSPGLFPMFLKLLKGVPIFSQKKHFITRSELLLLASIY